MIPLAIGAAIGIAVFRVTLNELDRMEKRKTENLGPKKPSPDSVTTNDATCEWGTPPQTPPPRPPAHIVKLFTDLLR